MCVWVCQFSNAIDKILPFLVSTHTHPSISPNSFSATRPIYSTQRNFLLQLVYNWSALLFLNLYFNVFCFFHLSLTTHTSRLASNYVHLCSAALPFVPCATLVSHVHIGWQSILFYFIPFVSPYIDVPCGVPFGTQSHRLVSCKNAKMTITRQISETR